MHGLLFALFSLLLGASPVEEGEMKLLREEMVKTQLAGRDITNYVVQSLRDRGEKIPGGDAIEVAMKIKEKYGYVCKDVLAEFDSYDKKGEENGKMTQSAKFKSFVHKTLNGNMVNVDVGYERFMGPEMFFHPEFIHKDFMKPLGEVVDDAI